eukprot:GDKI01031252.1.p1 GENE.GDKI01031252.1~~GDKI01031252.1.p1  ORF type:complete len:162 (-),score=48.46 GDKI01031252.1:160-645(-)
MAMFADRTSDRKRKATADPFAPSKTSRFQDFIDEQYQDAQAALQKIIADGQKAASKCSQAHDFANHPALQKAEKAIERAKKEYEHEKSKAKTEFKLVQELLTTVATEVESCRKKMKAAKLDAADTFKSDLSDAFSNLENYVEKRCQEIARSALSSNKKAAF